MPVRSCGDRQDRLLAGRDVSTGLQAPEGRRDCCEPRDTQPGRSRWGKRTTVSFFLLHKVKKVRKVDERNT